MYMKTTSRVKVWSQQICIRELVNYICMVSGGHQVIPVLAVKASAQITNVHIALLNKPYACA